MSSLTNMENYTFYLQTSKTPPIKTTSEVLKEILTEGNLECSSEGIKLMAMDSSHTVLIHLKLEGKNFEEYYCPNKNVLGVDIISFHKIIKTMENSATLKLYVKVDNPNVLGIDMFTREKNTLDEFELNLMDLNHRPMNAQPAKFESVISMKSDHFQKICRDMSNFSEKVEIKSVGSELVFRGCSVNIKHKSVIRPASGCMEYIQNENPDEIIQGVFDLKFLVSFSKCTSLSNEIYIHLKNDYPIILKCDVASLGEIKLCLAPQTDDI